MDHLIMNLITYSNYRSGFPHFWLHLIYFCRKVWTSKFGQLEVCLMYGLSMLGKRVEWFSITPAPNNDCQIHLAQFTRVPRDTMQHGIDVEISLWLSSSPMH